MNIPSAFCCHSKKAAKPHQNNAPGPPATIAVAILPVPIVAETINAQNL